MWFMNEKQTSFRGRMGFTRTTRRDEVVVYKDTALQGDIITEVLGRKAWRCHQEGKIETIKDVVAMLNSGVLNETAALEALEMEWANGSN